MAYSNAISASDPQAIEKLTMKLEKSKELQATMKEVNAYWRKSGTCVGAPGITEEQAKKIDAKLAAPHYSWDNQPFSSYDLTNNNSEIKRLEKRIGEITRNQEVGFSGWEFNGGRAEANTVADENPENDKDTADLKIRNIPIVITKTDVRTKAALNGVAFQVMQGDTAIPFIKMENGAWIKADVAPKGNEDKATATLPTDKDGKLTIYGMGQGEYALREMEALPGYVLPAEKLPFKVNANAEPIGNFALTNEPTVLAVSKVDSTTEAPLDGAAFRIMGVDGKPILLKQQESGEYYPDEKGAETFTAKDGKATLCYLPLGKLTIEETMPPKGYAAAAPIPIELKSEHVKAKPLAVTVKDSPLAVVIRKTTKANTPLTGAGFAITTGSAASRPALWEVATNKSENGV